MRQLDPESSNPQSTRDNLEDEPRRAGAPSPPLGGEERVGEKEGGSSRSAFSPDFLAELARRDPAPATPEADNAGPWRVTPLYGAGTEPRWACLAAGEGQPRLTLQAPDLAYLAAAALAVAERPPTFRFQEDAARRLDLHWHLLWHGRPVGTARGLIPVGGDTLALHMGGLADLRVQPLAFAHYLLSVPDETLRRSGRILMDILREARR